MAHTLKLPVLLLLLSALFWPDAIRLAAWVKISRAWVMLFLTLSANLISSGNSYSQLVSPFGSILLTSFSLKNRRASLILDQFVYAYRAR
jgi:hypothetical protein